MTARVMVLLVIAVSPDCCYAARRSSLKAANPNSKVTMESISAEFPAFGYSLSDDGDAPLLSEVEELAEFEELAEDQNLTGSSLMQGANAWAKASELASGRRIYNFQSGAYIYVTAGNPQRAPPAFYRVTKRTGQGMVRRLDAGANDFKTYHSDTYRGFNSRKMEPFILDLSSDEGKANLYNLMLKKEVLNFEYPSRWIFEYILDDVEKKWAFYFDDPGSGAVCGQGFEQWVIDTDRGPQVDAGKYKEYYDAMDKPDWMQLTKGCWLAPDLDTAIRKINKGIASSVQLSKEKASKTAQVKAAAKKYNPAAPAEPVAAQDGDAGPDDTKVDPANPDQDE